MPVLLKPAKRGPRKPRRIARSRKPIARHSRPHAIRQTARRLAQLAEDAAWSQAVRDRANGYCERSGRQGTDAHHVWPKSHYGWLRHNADNGVYLSRAEHDRAHATPKSFRVWFAVTFPQTWLRLEKARREA